MHQQMELLQKLVQGHSATGLMQGPGKEVSTTVTRLSESDGIEA